MEEVQINEPSVNKNFIHSPDIVITSPADKKAVANSYLSDVKVSKHPEATHDTFCM